MRKLILLVIASLMLAACGGTTNEQTESDEEEYEEESMEDDPMEEAIEGLMEESEGSNDWMALGNKNSGEDVYQDGAEIYNLLDYYSTDDTDEDGFTHVEFDGYEFKYSLAYGESPEGEEVILMFGEAENGTDETVAFNAEMNITTDTQEQTETQMGFEKLQANMKATGYDTMPLEYGKPESFTLTLDPPMLEIAEDEYDSEYFGEPIEMEYTID